MKVPVILTAAALALAVAGCGGGDDTSKSKDASTSSVMEVADHDALVKLAKEEGEVTVSTSFTEDTIPKIKEGFEAKYGIKLNITEQTGDDDKRVLLELQSGTSKLDVLHLSAESYDDYQPFTSDIDLLALTKKGVLEIPEKMINAKAPNNMAAGSGIGAFSWNPKRLPENEVPTSWDDFLKPDLKGKKFLVDIEPANLAILGAAWGEDKLIDYAKKIKEQKPIWVRGDTNSLTLMAAGEYALHAFSNYHSAYRVSKKSDDIKIALLEPIPVRLTQIQAIHKDAAHPAAAALFMEYTASEEAQKILDEDEPMQSSIYAPGSTLNKLTEGKETAVIDWERFHDQPKWEKDIVKAWGFPTAEVEKK